MARKDYTQVNKKPTHFNVIDAVIIILVIAVVLGSYFRFNIVERLTQGESTKNYTVSFLVENIRYTTPNYLNVGNEVYFADTNELFGTVVSESANKSVLSITPASKSFIDSSGKIVELFYPTEGSRIDAKGYIQCKGVYTEDGGFCVNGTRYIASGQVIDIKTELVTLSVTITDIEAVSE